MTITCVWLFGFRVPLDCGLPELTTPLFLIINKEELRNIFMDSVFCVVILAYKCLSTIIKLNQLKKDTDIVHIKMITDNNTIITSMLLKFNTIEKKKPYFFHKTHAINNNLYVVLIIRRIKILCVLP